MLTQLICNLYPDFILLKSVINDVDAAGILKYLGEDLKRHPENRCSSTDQCTEKVLKGSSVYIFVIQIF